MGMFFGTYQRNLDNKFRLQLPNKLVKEMPEHFYLLRGFEGALSIYEEKDFQKYLSSLEKMSLHVFIILNTRVREGHSVSG